MPERNLAVVKVGGSLFSYPNLARGLRDWLADQPEGQLLLIPGGAALADAIREYHRVHDLSEETCHWLALRTMTINAEFLASLLPGSVIVADAARLPADRLLILDGHAFAEADESRPGRLPHTWDVTSDSVAARAALMSRAGRLVLLKSVAIAPTVDWREAASRGWIDPTFPELASAVPRIEVVAFRSHFVDSE